MDELKKNVLESMGPFEVPCTPLSESGDCVSTSNPERELVRELDCKNYTTCLNLAAALNWESFTCEGCQGEINQSLTWRASQGAIRDKIVKFFCGETRVNVFRGSKS
jgi:hypothetical protein